MGSEFITTTLAEKINYIAIKIIEKKNDIKEVGYTKDVMGGLFKGLIEHKDTNNEEHTFLLTEQKNEKDKDVINGVNLKYYNILALQIVSDDNKVWVFATKEDKDQERIRSIVVSCLKALKKGNMVIVNDESLVNTKLYTGVPPGITIIKKIGNVVGGAFYKNSGSYSNSQCNTYKPTVKKVPESTFFEFKNTNTKNIESMKLKLDLVLIGTFKPELPAEIEGKEGPKTVSNGNYYGGMGNAYGY